MKDFLDQKIDWKIGIVILVLVGGVGFSAYKIYAGYRANVSFIVGDIRGTESRLNGQIDELKKEISDLKKQNTAISDTIIRDQESAGSVLSQVGKITSTVGELSKLSQTDPELLKKYSKVYFLNEHYVPLSLANIDQKYLLDKNRNLQLHSSVYPFIQKLLDASASPHLSLEVDSAFRSFSTQAVLKSGYRFTYGAGTANQFSAEQGYSEHQLGTTVDFTTLSIGGALVGFDKTPEYEWLKANAYLYGFVLSYPPGNAYYKFEPWHWRFVGVELATKLHQDNMYFYDMDQRVIDTYLSKIFD